MGAKPAKSPLEKNKKINIVDYDKHVRTKGDKELQDVGGYYKLIGKLIYLTITRPVIYFAVQVLSQFMQHLKHSHLYIVMSVIKYVKNSLGRGILLKKDY